MEMFREVSLSRRGLWYCYYKQVDSPHKVRLYREAYGLGATVGFTLASVFWLMVTCAVVGLFG